MLDPDTDPERATAHCADEDADLTSIVPSPRDRPDVLSPLAWLEARPILKRLAIRTSRSVSTPTVASWLRRRGEDRDDAMMRADALITQLVAVEYIQPIRSAGGYTRNIALTVQGRHALRCVGAPKGSAQPELGHDSFASRLSFALAAHYGVDAYAMLRTGVVGPAVVARARLCAALHGRGWSAARIARYFAMDIEWVRRGIDRWPALEKRGSGEASRPLVASLSEAKAAATRALAEQPRCGAIVTMTGETCDRPALVRGVDGEMRCGHHRARAHGAPPQRAAGSAAARAGGAR